jgi:class 3 adenylate cyclase
VELIVEKARVERHLAAILAADVAGYSRLMGSDEVGTVARLRAHRKELFDPAIENHRGHIANTAGDSVLAEFSSVVDAVACAVEIQRGMFQRNSAIPPDQGIEFRIGINLGDIISEGTDIFGEGVNVAARLESIADRGGICISRQVLDQVEGKLDVTYRELGPTESQEHRKAGGGLRDPTRWRDVAGLAIPRHREAQAGDTLLQGARRCPTGIRDGRQRTTDTEVGALDGASRI